MVTKTDAEREFGVTAISRVAPSLSPCPPAAVSTTAIRAPWWTVSEVSGWDRRTHRGIAANIAIMRAFVRLRQILATHKELAERLAAMEQKHDHQVKKSLIS